MYTPIVDTCTRADENPLSNGGFWTTSPVLFVGDFTLRIISNTIQSGATQGSAYSVARYGPDCEVYGTQTTSDGGVDFILRLLSPGTASQSGYWFNFDVPGDLVAIYRLQAQTIKTVLLKQISATIVTGDTLGGRCVGSRLSIIRNDVEILTVYDSMHTRAGHIGLVKYNAQSPWTSIGGGTLSTLDPLDTSLYPRAQLDGYAI